MQGSLNFCQLVGQLFGLYAVFAGDAHQLADALFFGVQFVGVDFYVAEHAAHIAADFA